MKVCLTVSDDEHAKRSAFRLWRLLDRAAKNTEAQLVEALGHKKGGVELVADTDYALVAEISVEPADLEAGRTFEAIVQERMRRAIQLMMDRAFPGHGFADHYPTAEELLELDRKEGRAG